MKFLRTRHWKSISRPSLLRQPKVCIEEHVAAELPNKGQPGTRRDFMSPYRRAGGT